MTISWDVPTPTWLVALLAAIVGAWIMLAIITAIGMWRDWR